jgi:transposase
MMGKQPPPQDKLFYYNLNLDERIPSDHPLRRIKAVVDFDFVSAKVESLYGTKGNVSVPPPVILKLMFLLFYDNVASERELMKTLPMRLDWLWFLDFDLDSEIPDHSVLSKARARWGREAFGEFFQRIVWQCVEAGLVDGTKIFCDSSLVDADASNTSVMERRSFIRFWKQKYGEFERRYFVQEGQAVPKHVSTTDPDASVVRKGKGKPKVRYAEHRAVDSRHGVITATETTPGAVNEAHKLSDLLDGHQKNTHRRAEVVVADSKYGTIENYLALRDRKVKAHIPDLSESQKDSGRRAEIFDISEFIYDETSDTYTCPAGQRLVAKKYKKKRKAIEYSLSKRICMRCELRDRCTRNKNGARTITRHLRQDELETMRRLSKSVQSRRDLRTRKHFMERSYADAANNHGFKRSRWRGLDRITIQDLMIAAVQNIRILIKHARKPSGVALEMRMAGQSTAFEAAPLYQSLCFAAKYFLELPRLSYIRCFEVSYS